jgi:hypothetical protein
MLLLLVSVACTWACTVPTLDELEQEDPGGCDETHPCREGSVCFEKECIPTQGLGCIPGSTLACGNETRGACRQGTRLCDREGHYGACTGEVGATAETCNGLDDDCDDSTDEDLSQACEKQQGVCAGAREECTAGSFKGCTTATYAAQSNGYYQPFETSCDNQDNDCDALTDRWASTLLIAQPGGFPLGAVAVNRISSLRPPTVLTLIPSKNNLETRVLSVEGLRSGAVIPPASGFIPTSPVLVADEDRVTAAWVEEKSLDPNFPEIRLHMAVLDGGGELLLGPVLVSENLPQERISDVQLVMGPNRVLVLVTFATSKEVWVFTIGRNLENRSRAFHLGTLTTSKSWVHAIVRGGNNSPFLVTIEHNNNRQLGVITEAGLLESTMLSLGQYTNADDDRPFIIPAPAADQPHTIVYVKNMNTFPAQAEVRYIQCTTGSAGRCNQSMLIKSYGHHLDDMKPLTYPGFRAPHFILLKWREVRPDVFHHDIAPFTLDTIGEAFSVPIEGPPILSDTVVLSPEGTFFLVYLQPPPPQLQSLLPALADAKVLPFCKR